MTTNRSVVSGAYAPAHTALHDRTSLDTLLLGRWQEVATALSSSNRSHIRVNRANAYLLVAHQSRTCSPWKPAVNSHFASLPRSQTSFAAVGGRTTSPREASMSAAASAPASRSLSNSSVSIGGALV
eukprot:GHRR01016918.1.p2 GENE.GHRR01016918.1~~GHRR01016918.1.p2  ORF type:complete len:127 (+),score=29.75 GHRR01016918.1:795-1175(+)